MNDQIIRGLIICLIFFALATRVVSDEIRIANDPSRIGIGARVLGMGSAYVGLSDDLASIFINPAGLAEVKELQLTSMQGRFINEYDYINFGGALPMPFGTFGLGYVGNSVSFVSQAVTFETDDGIRIIASSSEGGTYTFSDQVILFSLGRPLAGLTSFSLLDDFSVGATLKIFALGMTGPGIDNGNASGTEMDLGLHYKPNKIVQAGFVWKNALHYDMGGKIVWNNGREETIPSTMKAGVTFQLLGKEAWRKFGHHELSLNIDTDFAPFRSNVPLLWHIGTEWSPLEMLDIRLGVDQDYVGTNGSDLEATNNLTMGVGLYFGNFRFDYAFHQYNQVTDNDSHYFSLSYGLPTEDEGKKQKSYFVVLPADQTILFYENVNFQGIILEPDVSRVDIDLVDVPIDRNRFQMKFPLELGKNSFVARAYEDRALVHSQKIRVLRLMRFNDVSVRHWAAVPVSILAMEKVISGYPDGTFKPEGNITRAEMCALLIKSLTPAELKRAEKLLTPAAVEFEESEGLDVIAVSEETRLTFNDVPANHWAARYIALAVQLGVVNGYPDNTFRPNGYITRAEGVTIISRFAKLPASRISELPFPDLIGRYWATPNIAAAKDAGLLQYLGDGNFEVNRDLTRAEVAEILSKTPAFAPIVQQWLNWDEGY
ncbi:MAG: S-layer homology domain-containing protein [Candidatus Margulisbacteria bacterium]|nr:S-layer homology domain-containing protein [Candidatus Margulisiibacteriota bacterium]